ncbi:MAG: nuclear transport factor 2 family protein [Sphingobium sp.]
MATDGTAIDMIVAKEAIRELAMLYSRGVDRKDAALLRTLYTADATDTHGDSFDGGAEDYVQFLERSFPHMRYSGHHICNHLISVHGDEGEGEVYAIAWHIIPDRAGGWIEDVMCCRYIDKYRREADGRWRFARRVVSYDMRTQRPHVPHADAVEPTADPSYDVLASALFQRGGRS